MGRQRHFATAAGRQRAYRRRRAGDLGTALRQVPPQKTVRQPSRPARIAALQVEVQALLSGYVRWLESLPEALQDGEPAVRLTETIDQLEAVADLLSEMEPPKGFGRD